MAKHVGRHRAPGFSPLSELTQIAGDTAKPAARVTAVMAVSSGLIAGMVVPAQAATIVAGADGVAADGQAADGPTADRPIIDILGVSGVSGVPATDGPGLTPAAGLGETVESAVIEVGPVVSAPASVAALPAFGTLGFTTKKVTVAAPAARVSRSTTTAARTSPAASTTTVVVPVQSGSIIAVAASLLGIPYRYGGSSPSTGFDCSGFTSYVYKVAKGIILPRTAEGQRRGAVKISNPVPGDLVFFGNPATHVGIYAGNGMMYDSPHTGDVTRYRKIYSSSVTYGRY